MGLVATWHVGSSWTRDRTYVPFIGKWILIHCTTREILCGFFKPLGFIIFSSLEHRGGALDLVIEFLAITVFPEIFIFCSGYLLPSLFLGTLLLCEFSFC